MLVGGPRRACAILTQRRAERLVQEERRIETRGVRAAMRHHDTKQTLGREVEPSAFVRGLGVAERAACQPQDVPAAAAPTSMPPVTLVGEATDPDPAEIERQNDFA